MTDPLEDIKKRDKAGFYQTVSPHVRSDFVWLIAEVERLRASDTDRTKPDIELMGKQSDAVEKLLNALKISAKEKERLRESLEESRAEHDHYKFPGPRCTNEAETISKPYGRTYILDYSECPSKEKHRERSRQELKEKGLL